MKKVALFLGAVILLTAIVSEKESNAQIRHHRARASSANGCSDGTSGCGGARGCCGAKGCGGGIMGRTGGVIYAGTDVEGMTITNDVGHVGALRSMKMASHNAHYSPQPFYTYNKRGIGAGLTHGWNQQEQAARPWHGGYNYWRWGEPTALVVPPTSAYQTSYAWGVGQVRSTPIHHQFGRNDAGMIGGGGGGMFSNTPYWPSSTNQMGVYPVRAPW